MSDTLRFGLDSAIVNRQGMSAIRQWSAKGRPFDVEIGINIDTPEINGTYNITLGSETRGEYGIKRESCTITYKDKDEEASFETSKGRWIKQRNVSRKVRQLCKKN